MNKERPRKSNREEKKVFERPKKASKDTNNALAALEKLEESKISSEPASDLPAQGLDDGAFTSPWNNLAKFCNNAYEEFIPRSEVKQRSQESIAFIQRKCVHLLSLAQSETWDEIIEKNFSHTKERETARYFFRNISRRKSDGNSPATAMQQLKINLILFAELAENAFMESENRDLVKLDAIADIINNYQGQERTFLFLSVLSEVLDEKHRLSLRESKGYQEILRWGASPYIRNFWHRLQQKFRITRVAIKNEAAQNLARELGETSANLGSQMEMLKSENNELKNAIEDIRLKSLESAVYEFAKTLQSQPEPVLDQIFFLHQRLQTKVDEGVPLSPADSVSVLITLEALLKAFQQLNINQFPTNTNQEFELNNEQLGEYSYVEGSAFGNEPDKKVVRCIRPGWRVGEEIITPARVKEVTDR